MNETNDVHTLNNFIIPRKFVSNFYRKGKNHKGQSYFALSISLTKPKYFLICIQDIPTAGYRLKNGYTTPSLAKSFAIRDSRATITSLLAEALQRDVFQG